LPDIVIFQADSGKAAQALLRSTGGHDARPDLFHLGVNVQL
jgi:hypothetical protein